MTNKLETSLEQTSNVFLEMAKEIKKLREELDELQILVNKHESIGENLLKGLINFTK